MDIIEKIARKIEKVVAYHDFNGSVFDEKSDDPLIIEYREFLLAGSENLYNEIVKHHSKQTYKVIPLYECENMSYGKLNKYFESYTNKSNDYSYKLASMLENKEP